MSEQEKSSIYHILAFTFPGKDRAAEVAKTLKIGAKNAGLKVVAGAVIEVDERGKTKVRQPGRGGMGATLGLGMGTVLGLVGGPAGLLVWAAGGALMGGVAGKYLGRMLPQDALKQLGQQMEPNSSAILAIAEDKEAQAVVDGMAGYNANIVTLTVGDQLSGEIAQYVAADVELPEDVDWEDAEEEKAAEDASKAE